MPSFYLKKLIEQKSGRDFDHFSYPWILPIFFQSAAATWKWRDLLGEVTFNTCFSSHSGGDQVLLYSSPGSQHVHKQLANVFVGQGRFTYIRSGQKARMVGTANASRRAKWNRPPNQYSRTKNTRSP